VIELRGDEALAVFRSARQALRAAVDLQLTFADEVERDASVPLCVGIGRCRRSGPGRGRLPRRGAEPRRPALLEDRSGGGARQPGGPASRALGRGDHVPRRRRPRDEGAGRACPGLPPDAGRGTARGGRATLGRRGRVGPQAPTIHGPRRAGSRDAADRSRHRGAARIWPTFTVRRISLSATGSDDRRIMADPGAHRLGECYGRAAER
jgi:hypothetical protein